MTLSELGVLLGVGDGHRLGALELFGDELGKELSLFDKLLGRRLGAATGNALSIALGNALGNLFVIALGIALGIAVRIALGTELGIAVRIALGRRELCVGVELGDREGH